MGIIQYHYFILVEPTSPVAVEEKPVNKCSHMFRSGSLKGAIFNLCSATLGAGCLALPKAISQAGLTLGMIYLMIGYFATILSIYYLLRARKVTQCGSYEELSVFLFNHVVGYIVEICIILFCFGTCVSYMVAIGDILKPIIDMLQDVSSFFNRTSVTIIFTLIFVLPLSLMVRINNLRFTSLSGIIMILYLILLTSIISVYIYSYNHLFLYFIF